MAEPKKIEVILDSDYMFPLKGESQAAFEERMAILRKKRKATMTDEEKRQVAHLLSGADKAAAKLGYK
jgi:hypothetical protein